MFKKKTILMIGVGLVTGIIKAILGIEVMSNLWLSTTLPIIILFAVFGNPITFLKDIINTNKKYI